MLASTLTLIVKELIMLIRDKQTRMIIIVPVLLQVTIFPFAATLEVTNARVGVFNEDNGRHSSEIIQRLAMAKAFSRLFILHNDVEVKGAIDNQQMLLLIRFPADFSRKIESGQGATLQVIEDGRRSNSAQVGAAYIQDIVNGYQQELLTARGKKTPDSVLFFRNWFNPNLDYKWLIVPSLIALITTIGVLVITALSVAREREYGTLDQLLVSPLVTWQIFVGKAVPAIIVATIQGTIVLLAGVFCYKIAFQGSLLLFYFCIFVYGLSLVGYGLLISALCMTQQQAFIGVFLFMAPSILLSGYIAPIENMPEWLQYVTMASPLRYFIELTKQLYLKDAPFAVIKHSLYPMFLQVFITGTAAYLLFKRKVS